MLLLVDALFQQETGGLHATVTRLRDPGVAPYCHGVAADVSLQGLPGVAVLDPAGPPPAIALTICEAVNRSFEFGDGSKETAVANGASIRVQVPVRGFSPVANCLAEWPAFGAAGATRHTRADALSLVAHDPVKRHRRY